LMGAPQEPKGALVGGLLVKIPTHEFGGACQLMVAFACARGWRTLEKTAEEGVRYCDGCKLNVYLCSKQEEVDAAMDQGRCIAVRLPEAKWD
jgi:hypothetical protein